MELILAVVLDSTRPPPNRCQEGPHQGTAPGPRGMHQLSSRMQVRLIAWSCLPS